MQDKNAGISYRQEGGAKQRSKSWRPFRGPCETDAAFRALRGWEAPVRGGAWSPNSRWFLLGNHFETPNPTYKAKIWTNIWPQNCRIWLVSKHLGVILCPDFCSYFGLVCKGRGHSRISDFRGSVINGGFQTVVRVWSGDQIPLPQFYLNLTSI